MKAGELKDQLAVLPGAKYENMDQAKVLLIRHLEALYASTPTTCADGKVIAIDWRVRQSWLDAKLTAIMFPPAPQLQEARAETQAKKPRLLGMGAFACTARPTTDTPLLLAPAAPSPAPLPQLQDSSASPPEAVFMHVLPVLP